MKNRNKKAKNNMDNKNKHNWKYALMPVVFVIVCICIYFVICFVFTRTDLFPAEEVLEKKDWLNFLGTYLSMYGALAIGLVAVWQTRYYNRKNEERRQEEYEQKTKPKLSISIINQDSWIEGMRDFESSEGKILTRLDHDNITLEIRNVGEYPTTNIYIDDKFVEPSLLSGEKTTIHLARPGSPDLENYPQLFIELLGESFTDDGLPKNLFLQSDDINGRLVGHEYKLNILDGKEHYSYSEEPYYLT